MELVYRGIKYNSKNLIALKIVREQKHKIIYAIRTNQITIERNFPISKYLKQLFFGGQHPVCHPQKFWYKHQIDYLENCWQLSEIQLIDFCWKITLEMERQAKKSNSPIKLKYRGVTYYK